MNDDWRLRIDLHEDGRAHALSERLEALALEHGLRASFGDRIVVSRDGASLFCYTGIREQADQLTAMVEQQAGEHGWESDVSLCHWHPAAGEWRDPDEPLPASDAELAAEHAELIRQERLESEVSGDPEYEVRVECASREEALAFRDQLRDEGIAAAHRWRYVFVGAGDEDAADALAERLRTEVPAGSTVVAEGSLRAVMRYRPRNPFAFLGGLGG